jgi:predicted dehydrogenase
MTPLRIGIIGAGANTRLHHIPKLKAQKGVEIAGVANRSRASSEAAAGAFNIPRIYDHWKQAIDDPDTQAIVIGTWPYLHAPAAIAALDAGKHVMTEARMACNAAEARAMLAASRRRPDLIAQVVPAPFSLGVDRTVQRLIAEGYLGNLLVIEHRQAGAFLDPLTPLHWRQDPDRSGLNIMMLGIVYEMIMRWAGEATRVTAQGKTFVPMRHDTEQKRMRAVRVPDHLDVLADMACGAQLHIQQSAVTAHLEGGGTWLYGSEGVLRFHDGHLTGARKGEAGLRPVRIPAREKGGWRVEEEFVRAIRGLEPIRHTTFEDGVKYMEFVEAVTRSLKQERAIPLPLD